MPTIGEQADIATEDGSPIQSDQEDSPVWRENGEEIPISEMTDEDIQNAIEQVEGRMNHHRERIFSRYQSLNTLVDVRNNLSSELEERGINLMIPQVETLEE